MEGVASQSVLNDAAQLAPRPVALADTGLTESFVTELILRTLYQRGSANLATLADLLALAGSIVEPLIGVLRRRAAVESTADRDGTPRFRLTDKGQALAREAFARCGYVGPAPVPLAQFEQVVRAQSCRGRPVDRRRMQAILSDVVVEEETLDRLGPALHSARPALIYGPAGSGKSFIARRLIRAFDDPVLLPRALQVGGDVIQFYDPVIHHQVEAPSAELAFARGYDPRFVRCRRPLVVTGGELSPEMLDLRYGEAPATATAPVQLKSTNGLLIVDDFGRQKISPAALFNRWIVPLEERRDYLTDSAGHHVEVPFETLLLFSTNLNPTDLADEAFLRRLGNKIRFDYCTPERFRRIWRRCCEQLDLGPNDGLLEWLLEARYRPEERPLSACHPRDLIDLALSVGHYRGERGLSRETLAWAWQNYFVTEGEKAPC